ncbi:hypothetical protein HC766_01300 [Candidatus Gracilibacteria bacterium]|nr:hypothetical protein [Candidatus Gracilibacteria bacterium]
MMGVWSLGDYFKIDSIRWTYDFLTSPDYLGLDPRRLFVTVYRGSDKAERDIEAVNTWKEVFGESGIEADSGVEFDWSNPDDSAKYLYRITQRSGKDNWWGLPYKGPCGPCSEVYYLLDSNNVDLEKNFEGKSLQEIEVFIENQVVEIWNNVFMQFEGVKDENDEPLEIIPMISKNIDTGVGYERLLTVLNNKKSPYETDLFTPILEVVDKYSR